MRNSSLDAMKGIAVAAVVFYHLKILEYGFLGVDVFFVIGGYLTARSISRRLEENRFSCREFMVSRLVRLFPLVLLAGFLSLAVGFAGMLPDDFENLSESIVASNVFSNNILAAITTKNYWDIVNDYKPLMHLWYVGVLFEFYIAYVLIVKGTELAGRHSSRQDTGTDQRVKAVCAVLSLVSLVLYLCPVFSAADKFYYLPFRFFEFGTGVLCFYYGSLFSDALKRREAHIGAVVLIVLCFCGLSLPDSVLLIGTVLLTGISLVSPGPDGQNRFLRCLSWLGVRSYSIFIWHQVLLAFYRYYFTSRYGIGFVLLYWAAVLVLSELSYRLVEQKFCSCSVRTVALVCAGVFVFTSAASLAVFAHAGIVRDVPELDIYMDNVRRGMHSEYCDRIRDYDHEFEDNGKLKVLLIGNSFARDFGNMILESEWGDRVDLTYVYSCDETTIPRIQAADYIFIHGPKDNLPEEVTEYAVTEEIWGIGTKSFGECNGSIYKNRFSEDYFEQRVRIDPSFEEANEESKSLWGDRYIDMIGMVQGEDGTVPVFSDEHKFISQDCRHLTRGGAEYYARIMDWDRVFGKSY